MGEGIDPRKYIRFYGFWLWEYQRRNPEYRADYDEYQKIVQKVGSDSGLKKIVTAGSSSIEIDSALEKPTLEFYRKHNRLPKNPDLGEEPGVILEDKNKGEFDHVVDDSMDLDVSALLGEPMTTKAIGRSFPSAPKKVLTLEIDLETDVEKVLKEVKYLYYKWQEWGGSHKEAMEEFVATWSSQDEAIKAFADLIPKELPGISRRTIAPIPRAIGVWVWDYFRENGNENYDKAIAALSQEHGDFFDIRRYSQESNIRKCYQKTLECIDQVLVLPMTTPSSKKNKS